MGVTLFEYFYHPANNVLHRITLHLARKYELLPVKHELERFHFGRIR